KIKKLDINLILNYLAISSDSVLYKNLVEDENLMVVKSKEDFRLWFNKYPETAIELLLNIISLAGDNRIPKGILNTLVSLTKTSGNYGESGLSEKIKFVSSKKSYLVEMEKLGDKNEI
ncbi:hypothetical protein Golomagni_02281, partial [Golovinomyces magnicellulatus]